MHESAAPKCTGVSMCPLSVVRILISDCSYMFLSQAANCLFTKKKRAIQSKNRVAHYFYSLLINV